MTGIYTYIYKYHEENQMHTRKTSMTMDKNTTIWRCIYILLKKYRMIFPACQPCLDFPGGSLDVFFWGETKNAMPGLSELWQGLGPPAGGCFFWNNPGWSESPTVWMVQKFGGKKTRQSVSSSFSKNDPHYFRGFFNTSQGGEGFSWPINALFWKSILRCPLNLIFFVWLQCLPHSEISWNWSICSFWCSSCYSSFLSFSSLAGTHFWCFFKK